MAARSPQRPATPACSLSATLAHPVGVNGLWRYARAGRNVVRVYKTAEARAWEQAALLDLRAAGFRTLPEGVYWLAIDLHLYTVALDLDAGKIVLDTIAVALAVDDRWVGELIVHKTRVHHRAEQRLDVRVRIVPLEDPAEFNCWTARSTA